MIYLDNAATTRPKPPGVAEAVTAAMQSYGNSGRGVHEDALSAARMVFGVRQKLAEWFGCSRADHTAFTPNSTAALNIAIGGLLGPEDHVISTDWEHNSVLRPLYRLREQGMGLDFLPADLGRLPGSTGCCSSWTPPRRRGRFPLTWRRRAPTWCASPATRACWAPREPGDCASGREWMSVPA